MADLPANLAQLINDDYLVADISLRILGTEADNRVMIEGTYKIYDALYGLIKDIIQSQVSEFGGIPADSKDAKRILSLIFIREAFYGLMEKSIPKETLTKEEWDMKQQLARVSIDGKVEGKKVYNIDNLTEYARLLGYARKVSMIGEIAYKLNKRE